MSSPMVDPFWTWDPALLRRIGMACLLVGVSVLTANVLENQAGLARQPAVVVAVAVGAYGLYAWVRDPIYADAPMAVGLLVAVGLPLAIVLRLFYELATVN